MAKRKRKCNTTRQDIRRDIQQCLIELRPNWKLIIDQSYKEQDLLRDLLIWMAYADSGCPHLFTKCKFDLGPAQIKLHDSIVQLGGEKGSAVAIINAFAGWQATQKRERPVWCNKRCINTDSLRKIDRALIHILNTIKSQTGQMIEIKWEECQMTDERYKKWHPVLLWWGGIWFCVYLGHVKLGYLNCDSGTKFTIPVDDIFLNNNPYPPSYIVPMPTTRDPSENRTVLNMVIEEDRVMFLQKRWSPRLMCWLNNANKHIVSPLSVSTGVTVIYQLQKTGGLGLLEESLSKAFKTSVCVDVNEGKSEIVICCPKKQHIKAKRVLLRLIESVQACIESFPTKLSYPEEELDSTVKLLMGAGGLTHETDTHDGVENMAMLYVRAYVEKRKESDAQLTEDHVMARLTQDGFDISHVVKSNDFPRSPFWGSVTFAEYINHAAVTEELKNQGEFHCKWVRANDLYPKSLVVNFSVERRTLQQNIVRVIMATDRQLDKMKTVDWAKRISATPEYCGKKEVKMIFKTSYWNFHGLRKDIEKWAGVRVHDMKHDYAAPQPTSAKDLRDMEKTVKEAIKEHLDDFKKTEIRIDLPEPDDTEFKGRITLSDGNSRNFHGYELEDELENIRLRGKPVWTDGIDEVYELNISHEVYRVLKREITGELRKMTKDSICRNNSVTENVDCVVISICWFFTDNDPPKEVKNFASLLEPSVVVGVDSRVISAREKLDSIVKIERVTKTYIYLDKIYRQAKIYGCEANKKKARARLIKLMAEIQASKDMVMDICVPLEGAVLPRGLALELSRRYGTQLKEVCNMSDCDTLELDIKTKTVHCRGSLQSIESVMKELDRCCQRLTRNKDTNLFSRSVECCSCFTDVPEDNLRLENCGHLFCKECLSLQLSTYIEAKRFPITCVAESCDASLSVCDILTICNRSSLPLSKLVQSSLNYHLARNRHRVRPCPTTDCPMFYNVTADPDEFICPKCKKSLCSACHEPFHTGLSCDIKREIECLEDKKLKTWIQEQPKKRKMCPKCKSGIEKQMGCSNVHCASCHTYICWLCLKTFKESGDAYAHIDAKHTRRGENDWDEVDDVMGDIEQEVAEQEQIAQNMAGAIMQNGVGPAALNRGEQEPVNPERLQGIREEMGRVINRMQEVEQAGNVQPHRLQFLRAELEDIRHEFQLLENHVRARLQERPANPENNENQRQVEAVGGQEEPKEAEQPPVVEEPQRRVLRPRRGGVAALGQPPPVQENAAPVVALNNRQNQAAEELEQIGQRLREVVPADLGAPHDNPDLNEAVDGMNTGEINVNEFADIRPPRPAANAEGLPARENPRDFRMHFPGQLLADADQILEELEDFGQMMERIAGNKRADDDVQQALPPRLVPAPNRLVDLGAIFNQLNRQIVNDDGDNEVRLRLPIPRRLPVAGNAVDNQVQPAVNDNGFPNPPAPGLARVEPPRRVLRPRRNGGAIAGVPVLNVEQANNNAAAINDLPPPIPPRQPIAVDVEHNRPVNLQLGVNADIEQRLHRNNDNNADVRGINAAGRQEAGVQRRAGGGGGGGVGGAGGGVGPRAFRFGVIDQPPPVAGEQEGAANALQRFIINFQVGNDHNVVDGRPNAVANPVQVNVFPHEPNNANGAPQQQANDIIINNIDIPPLVRPLPLVPLGDNQQQVPPVAAAAGAEGRGAYNNLLGQLMPVLERAQMINPIPIRRVPAPAQEEPNVNQELEDLLLFPPLPMRMPALRDRAFMQPPRPIERPARPHRHHNTERDELGSQIQQIIASVQSPTKDKDEKVDEPEPGPSSRKDERVEEPNKMVYEKEEEINELIRRREQQEQALIEAMRKVMQEAGGNGEVTRKALPTFLRLRAEELKATKRMIDLKETIVNGDDTEITEAEKKVREVLQELENYEQNAVEEFNSVITKEANKNEEVEEPKPSTSAQSAHEAVALETVEGAMPIDRILRPRAKAGEQDEQDKVDDEESKEGEEEPGEVRARIQAMVRQRQQEGVNLHQALRDAIAQGGNNAEIQERLQPILMRLDADELTAMHRILEVLHVCMAEGLNPEQVEQRLQTIVNRQREDERTALEAMQAVVTQRNHQGQQIANVATGAGILNQMNAAVADGQLEGAAINVRVLQDQDYEQRLHELHRERDVEMAAIKQYTLDVVEKEDLTDDDILEITEVINIIIRAQEAQQRELLHGIPDFVRTGAKPEEVRERIEESMARYKQEEDEALSRMRAIMENNAQELPPQPPQRILRPRRQVAVAAAEPVPAQPNNENGNPETFREGLVQHITRIVELNRQLRQESLAQNVTLLEKLPKDGRFLGMVVLPHQRTTPDNNNDNVVPGTSTAGQRTEDTLVQSLREGEAVWIPAEREEVPLPGPVLPRMERRGAIVEEDMLQDVQSIQTTLHIPTDAEEKTPQSQGENVPKTVEEVHDKTINDNEGNNKNQEEQINNGANQEVEGRVLRRRVRVPNNNNNNNNVARIPGQGREQGREVQAQVAGDNGPAVPVQADGPREGGRRRGRRARRAPEAAPEQRVQVGQRRRRAAAAEPEAADEPPTRRARRR